MAEDWSFLKTARARLMAARETLECESAPPGSTERIRGDIDEALSYLDRAVEGSESIADEEAEYDIATLTYFLKAVNELAVDLTNASPGTDIPKLLTERLLRITGAFGTALSIYNRETRELIVEHVTLRERQAHVLQAVNATIGRSLTGMRMKVSDELYREIVSTGTSHAAGLSEASLSVIPRPVADFIHRTLGLGPLFAIALSHGDELVGTISIASKRGGPMLPAAIRRTVAHIAGGALRRARAEREREAAMAELRRSNEDLDRFASALSHDLREPLRSIRGFTGLLHRRYAEHLDTDGRELAGFVTRGVDSMQDMIDGLLALSRVTSRGAALSPLDPAHALDRARENLAAAIADSGASVRHGPMPNVMADEQQLVLLFQNLIANAIKFRSHDAPVVRITATRQAEMIEVTVKDNGIGIDPEHSEAIFEVFRRLPGPDTEGMGIGLALCRRIVQRHGGCIRVDSSVGKGSAFYFTLPAA